MTTNKKYDFRVIQKKSGWSAEIIRRVTSKKTAVSKSQDGFSTEAEAKAWGEKELASFLENLAQRNKRDSEQRTQAQKDKALRAEAYRQAKKEKAAAAAEAKTDSEDSDTSFDPDFDSDSEHKNPWQ